jgi:hypothetical protein
MSQASERRNDMMPFQAAAFAINWSTFRIASLLVLTGCATLPPAPVQRALYIDIRKALHGESRLGWTVDRVEIEEAAAQAEPSACEVESGQRASLRRWLDERIAAAGGPAAEQFRAGVKRDQLEDVIDLERARALLATVELHVPADCPFWVVPRSDFEGLHSVANRFVLLAESMGGASLSFTRGAVQAGGGGGARLFASYGFGTNVQLAVGVEAGGDAMLAKEERGKLAPEGAFRFGAPLLARWIDIDRIYDVELAAVTSLADGELSPWGARLALGGGVNGLRRLGFMPALQLWLGYELYPAQDGFSTQHVLRLGTRVGIDWDP